jgi:hypothetical protein
MTVARNVERMRLFFGRNNAAVGLLIRFFDIVPYQHVAIRCGESVYEAVGSRYKGRRGRRKGVIKTTLDDFKKRYKGWTERFIYLPEGKTLESIYARLQDLVDKKTDYDFLSLVGSLWIVQLFRIKLGHKLDFNCSELVNEVAGVYTHGVVTVASWFNISRPMSEY